MLLALDLGGIRTWIGGIYRYSEVDGATNFGLTPGTRPKEHTGVAGVIKSFTGYNLVHVLHD